MSQLVKLLAAAGGWATSVTLMIDATIDGEVWLRSWALYLAIVAWLPTLLFIVEAQRQKTRRELEKLLQKERRRTEAIIQGVALQMAARDVPRLKRESLL